MPKLRLLTYNIREGGVGRAEEIAEVIKAASNLGQNFPQIVVLGTANDAGSSSSTIPALTGFSERSACTR